jgi:hypothetical protein
MSLQTKIIFKWVPFLVLGPLFYLNEKEWLEMLNIFILKLSDTKTGNIIKNRLEYFISISYNIIISNKDESCQTIYPKFKCISYNTVLIIIPNVPYFISTSVINSEIINYKAFDEIIDIKKYKYINEIIPGFISFVHELIHTLRFFERIMSNINEEENVIYGLVNGVLKYKDNYITENMIRQEYGYKPRISHESFELLCYELLFTYKNKDSFLKSDFY